MMAVKLDLRYPGGERKIRNGVLDGSIAYEYVGIYPFGVKQKTAYLVYQKDVGYKKDLFGFLKRIVDIDVNESESMEIKEPDKEIKGKHWRKIVEGQKVEIKGRSIESRCTDLFNSKKQEFLKGYLARRIQIKKPGLDIASLITGFGIGGFVVMLLLEVLKLTQGLR